MKAIMLAFYWAFALSNVITFFAYVAMPLHMKGMLQDVNGNIDLRGLKIPKAGDVLGGMTKHTVALVAVCGVGHLLMGIAVLAGGPSQSMSALGVIVAISHMLTAVVSVRAARYYGFVRNDFVDIVSTALIGANSYTPPEGDGDMGALSAIQNAGGGTFSFAPDTPIYWDWGSCRMFGLAMQDKNAIYSIDYAYWADLVVDADNITRANAIISESIATGLPYSDVIQYRVGDEYRKVLSIGAFNPKTGMVEGVNIPVTDGIDVTSDRFTEVMARLSRMTDRIDDIGERGL